MTSRKRCCRWRWTHQRGYTAATAGKARVADDLARAGKRWFATVNSVPLPFGGFRDVKLAAGAGVMEDDLEDLPIHRIRVVRAGGEQPERAAGDRGGAGVSWLAVIDMVPVPILVSRR